MKITVETPKGSFVKYRFKDGRFTPELTSPFPTLFNYGFVEGTEGSDGMPQDCIIIGGRISQGEKLNLEPLGVVYFTDDGKEDNKSVFSVGGDIKLLDKISLHVFFVCYTIFKTLHYLAKEHRIARCWYGGVNFTEGRLSL
ncbi:MAG: inorganic diphosphatase [Candidatus Altiarchaeota archaeon]|nr:inorganic diphosphatase [Candidatus Altiarchaeota archaeon]